MRPKVATLNEETQKQLKNIQLTLCTSESCKAIKYLCVFTFNRLFKFLS